MNIIVMPPTETHTLVCFALEEEAVPFRRMAGASRQLRILITGIGPRNSEKAFREVLPAERPRLVLTCGLAGGLNPELVFGTIVFEAEVGGTLWSALLAAHARPGRFVGSERIIATAGAKQHLWRETKADAVEMESCVIRKICQEHQIPCAIVRVILDTAWEDLTLDFNRFLTTDDNIHYFKLIRTVLRRPRLLFELLRLQRKTRRAAQLLARTLRHAICNSNALSR